MPVELLIRGASLAVTAALCVGWRDAPGTLLWATYSLGFAHYFLAQRYSTRQMGQALASAPQALAVSGLGLLTLSLYYGGVSR
jgi:hypothetical protein